MDAASCLGKSGKPVPVPNSNPSKSDPDEHNFAPFLKNPISTPIPNNIKVGALSFGTDICTKLRREAAQNTASEPGGLTNDDGFSTIPAQDLEHTKILKRRNSRGSEDNSNIDGRQQFPGFPSPNSPHKDPTPPRSPEGSKKGHLLQDGGTAMGEMMTPSHQKAQKVLVQVATPISLAATMTTHVGHLGLMIINR